MRASATTNRCASCHNVHVACGPDLLPAATVTASCYTCHDGTGGRGVYGAIAARGETAEASHSIDATNLVPGGDGATGGPATMAFKGLGGNLGCGDCHSPHDANTVAPFLGDRHRTSFSAPYEFGTPFLEVLEAIKQIASYEMARTTMPWAGRVVFQHRAKVVA